MERNINYAVVTMSHTIILDPGQHEISLKKAVRLRPPEPIMNSIVLWILFQGTLFEFQLGEGVVLGVQRAYADNILASISFIKLIVDRERISKA